MVTLKRSMTTTTGVPTWKPTSSPSVEPPAPATAAAKQDPQHTEADFIRELDRATRRKSS